MSTQRNDDNSVISKKEITAQSLTGEANGKAQIFEIIGPEESDAFPFENFTLLI